MIVYWCLFGYFAFGALQERRGIRAARPLLLLGALFALLVIGLRFEVGADWRSYNFLFDYARYASFDRVVARGDPGYQALNWWVQRADYDLWVVNLVCATIFMWGLVRLAGTQPSPWLVMVVAVPYLIIVVAMGYSRQAVAIGVVMAGLASLARGGSVIRFALYVAVAALFHKTAVVVLPLLAFSGQRNRALNAIAGIAAFVLLYDLFLADDVDELVKNYVAAEYNSQGAAIRVAMNLVPAAIMLLKGRDLGLPKGEESMWRAFAWTSLLLLAVLIVSPSSTAVDRIALYMIPLQLVVLPRAIGLLWSEAVGRASVILYCFAIQFTWLNFATHARFWIPYDWYPIFA